MDEDPNLFCFFVFLPHVQCQHDALHIPRSPEGEQHCAGTAHSPAVPAHRTFKIEYLSFQCQTEIFRRGKRESGANPERSGHCERGDGCKMSLCISHEKAQPRSMIRKSGNLLKYLCIASEESDLPCGF